MERAAPGRVNRSLGRVERRVAGEHGVNCLGERQGLGGRGRFSGRQTGAEHKGKTADKDLHGSFLPVLPSAAVCGPKALRNAGIAR